MQPPVVDLERTIQTIVALREQHLKSIERFRDGLERLARSRALSHDLRERTSEARLTRQQRRRERQRTVT
ncbi:MAG: hypothetical protein ACLPTJ_22375 [Solirubrobacteraceae bacterium]